MKALIVEDSRLARLELKQLLKQHPVIEVVAEAANIEEAVSKLKDHVVDVIFLDINLPDGNGFELLASLTVIPEVIFTTAYDEYAIKAFDYNAIDYLMKPVNPAHLARALARLEQSPVQTDNSARLNQEQKIFVKDGEQCWLIEVGRIKYFESCGNHTQIYFDNNKTFIYKSLTKVEQRLPERLFLRANRQFIVNLDYVKAVEPWDNGGLLLTMVNGVEIEASRRHSIHFKQLLSL